MFRKTIVLVVLVLLTGCSSLSLKTLPGPMDRLGNERYGYRFLIPGKWYFDVNSNIRPTKLEVTAPKTDAKIIVTVMEGAKAPEMDNFVKELGKYKDTEAFTLIRNWRTDFDDNTGYVASFTWKGVILLGKKKCGKSGVEYQGTATMVERDPSPILMVCYAPKKQFKKINDDFFAHVRHSLKVKPVEITVRKVEED